MGTEKKQLLATWVTALAAISVPVMLFFGGSWFQNELKNNQNETLERIDAKYVGKETFKLVTDELVNGQKNTEAKVTQNEQRLSTLEQWKQDKDGYAKGKNPHD